MILVTPDELGTDATIDDAEHVVECLQSRGYDAAVGVGVIAEDDYVSPSDWLDCLQSMLEQRKEAEEERQIDDYLHDQWRGKYESENS